MTIDKEVAIGTREKFKFDVAAAARCLLQQYERDNQVAVRILRSDGSEGDIEAFIAEAPAAQAKDEAAYRHWGWSVRGDTLEVVMSQLSTQVVLRFAAALAGGAGSVLPPPSVTIH